MLSIRTCMTPEERLACWRFGSEAKVAQLGLSQADALEKTAASLLVPTPLGMAKTIAAVSLMTGIPAGIVAHSFGRRASNVKNRERKLEAEADYYADATDQLEAGMTAAGIT